MRGKEKTTINALLSCSLVRQIINELWYLSLTFFFFFFFEKLINLLQLVAHSTVISLCEKEKKKKSEICETR